MKPGGKSGSAANPETIRALRSVLIAMGGQAKIAELYRLLTAEEAARFLGLAEPTIRDMTYRHQIPHVKIGIRGVRYRLLDLIDWQERRTYPALP